MQQHGSKYLSHRTPPPPPGPGAQNSTVPSYGHGDYQLKGMKHRAPFKAHILSLHTPSTWIKR